MPINKENMRDYLDFLCREQKDIDNVAESVFNTARLFSPSETRVKLEQIGDMLLAASVATATLIAQERGALIKMREDDNS